MPHVRNRRASLLLLAAFLGLALAACSDDDGGGTDASLTTTTEAETGSGEEDAEVNTLAIDMKDYSYGITGDLEAGTGTITLRNSGAELHMAAFALLQEGKTQADVEAALRSEDESAFESVIATQLDAPGAVLSPGRSQQVTTDLLGAGTYAVICFLPTAGEAQPVLHAEKGMIGTFSVAPGDVEITAAEPDADYTVDDGEIEGPRTLEAGENALQFESAGGGPHEFFVIKKATPTTTYEDIDEFFTDLLEGDAGPPVGYADTAPGILVVYSFEVESGGTLLVTADLEPGDYLIGCASEPEAEGAEAHTGEILEVRIA